MKALSSLATAGVFLIILVTSLTLLSSQIHEITFPSSNLSSNQNLNQTFSYESEKFRKEEPRTASELNISRTTHAASVQKEESEKQTSLNQETGPATENVNPEYCGEEDPEQLCTDECSFEGECKSKKLCGNWDGDPCLEWKGVECCSEDDCNRDGWYFREYRDYECINYRCTYFVRERCTDSCYFLGLRSCAGNYVAVCGNFDDDPCLEWNCTEYCEYGCEMGMCKKRNACAGTFTGTVKRIIDGDTIELEECKERIRLALVDAPEHYQEGYAEAREFVKSLCPVGSKVTVDQDDGQPYDAYGRIVGVVYCNGKNLNAELVYRGLGKIVKRFCEKSEFAREDWAWNYGCGDALEGENCHPSYPEVCIPPPPPDLDCSDIPCRNFAVRWDVPDPDPHGFDSDKDGIGCES